MLVHVSAPSLGLAAAQWAVVSWGESQVMRESISDAKYIYRWEFLGPLPFPDQLSGLIGCS